MRASTLAALLSTATLAALACSVDRRSESLHCDFADDCTGLGASSACVGGYCVEPVCPAGCTSCDDVARTCQVDCTTASACSGPTVCPSGWSCTISCTGGGACSDLQCNNGSRCRITCSGDNACDNVQCEDACQCDLDCVGGTACGSTSCPERGNGANGVHCTADQTTATECDSTVDSRCAGC